MKRTRWIVPVLVAMLSLAIAACGPGFPIETYTVEGVFSMDYPEGWMVEEDEGVVGFTAEEATIEEMGFVVAYQLELMAATFEINLEDPAELLNFYYVTSELGEPQLREEQFGGGTWAISDYDYDDGEFSLRGFIAAGRGADNTILVIVGASPEAYETYGEYYNVMFESIQFE